ncbi:hypothetical protein ACP275_04G130600 [Erythranthe tilingii]
MRKTREKKQPDLSSYFLNYFLLTLCHLLRAATSTTTTTTTTDFPTSSTAQPSTTSSPEIRRPSPTPHIPAPKYPPEDPIRCRLHHHQPSAADLRSRLSTLTFTADSTAPTSTADSTPTSAATTPVITTADSTPTFAATTPAVTTAGDLSTTANQPLFIA